MSFEEIEKALMVMGKAMFGIMERLDKLIEIEEQVLAELKSTNT